MNKTHNATLLGAGLIGTFYAMTLHGGRGRDRVGTVCAQTEEEALPLRSSVFSNTSISPEPRLRTLFGLRPSVFCRPASRDHPV